MDSSQSTSDEAVAGRVQKGDSQAFAELVSRYELKMMRYARRFLFGHEDSQDVVQEVFLKAYSNMQGFDLTRRFSPWLYRIAHNEFINAIKKKGREPLPFFDPDTIFPHPLSKDIPDKDLNDAQLKEMMEKCLNKLNAKYREPLVLYFYEEMDYQNISEVMRIPISTVGVRIKRGKVFLQKAYNDLFKTV